MVSGSMESPASSEMVGRVGVYLADVVNLAVFLVSRSRGGELEKMS